VKSAYYQAGYCWRYSPHAGWQLAVAAETTRKMSTIYFTKNENYWKRWPEVEMVTGNGKFRALE